MLVRGTFLYLILLGRFPALKTLQGPTRTGFVPLVRPCDYFDKYSPDGRDIKPPTQEASVISPQLNLNFAQAKLLQPIRPPCFPLHSARFPFIAYHACLARTPRQARIH
jgi:hypothetical protein